jgi:hypothetical protein
MNTGRIILWLCLSVLCLFTQAKNSLDIRDAERYYAAAASDTGTLKIVNAVPIFTNFIISPPANGVNYVEGDIITIYATAYDPDGTIASIQFYVDGNPQGAAQVGTSQTFSASVPYTCVAGIHSLTATAIDNSNESFTTPAPISLTVDANVPPTVAITAPVNGATPALNAALTLNATASDPDGSVSTVEFFSGTTSLGMGILSAGVYSLTFTPAVPGPVILNAKATDNKGGITISAPVSVTITDFNIAYTFTQTSGTCFNNGFCIPITTVLPVANINGYNFVVQYDKTKVVPTGNITVSNDLVIPFLPPGHNAEYITDYATSIDAVAGTITIGIFFNSFGGSSAVFTGSGDVCCVEFVKSVNFQPVDTAVFSFNEIIESYPLTASLYKIGSAGKYISFKADTLHGSLKFWKDYSPIQFDPLNPASFLITDIFGCNQTTNAVHPDLSGNFAYSTSIGNTIDIKRDITGTTNVHSVINAQDAYFTILTSVKGTYKINWTPSVFQMIAMDVNRDGMITAGDATQINQRAVGSLTAFSQTDALEKDWSFLANEILANDLHYLVSTSFPQDDGLGYSKYRVPVVDACQPVPIIDISGCPIVQDENYIGVLLGDVDGNYASIAPNGLLKNAVSDTSEIVFDFSKALISNGEMRIPVSIISTEVVNSFDFDLKINDGIASVKSLESLTDIDLSWNCSAEKILGVASYSLKTIPTENTISIIFSLTGAENLKSNDLISNLAMVNGKVAKLVIIDAAAGIDDSKQNMVKLYPNPATDKLYIEVSVASKAQFIDLTGKQVIPEHAINANQSEKINVSNLAAGIYMVKIYNDKFVSMSKVVIQK